WLTSTLPLPATPVALDPGSGRLALLGQGVARVWEVAGGKELFAVPAPGNHLAFSPDGRRLLSCHLFPADSTEPPPYQAPLLPYDARGGGLVRSFAAAARYVPDMAFTPDGRRLAVALHPQHGSPLDAEGGARVEIWDCERGLTLLSLPGGSETVSGLTFAADARWLAVAT